MMAPSWSKNENEEVVIIKMKRPTNPNKFQSIAHLVIPWLTPQEVSSLSCTSRTLSHLSKLISTVRSSDASRSFESLPIPFINTVDSHPYAFFLYSPSLITPPSFFRQFWGFPPYPNPNFRSDFGGDFGGIGCDCLGKCGIDDDFDCDCPCCGLGYGDRAQVMIECGSGCRCESSCGNRMTQKGIDVKLKIVRVCHKGWGLFADQFIPSGTFVCEYAGELLTTQEARRRQQLYDQLAKNGKFCSALLVVREYLPSRKSCFRINIDATTIGNVARFINHSCDGGNVATLLVRSSGSVIPRVCFFTSKDIQAGEELSFSYGDARTRPYGLPCSCGSPNCFGMLPSEDT